MATTYTWNVNTLETKASENGLSNVVKAVHWRLKAENEEHSVENYSVVSLDNPNPLSFTEFENLTEIQVISWIESKLDVNEIKSRLDGRLLELANPPVLIKQAPWI